MYTGSRSPFSEQILHVHLHNVRHIQQPETGQEIVSPGIRKSAENGVGESLKGECTVVNMKRLHRDQILKGVGLFSRVLKGRPN